MIEVLVSVLILAIGMLGLAALQINTLKVSVSSLQRSQATFLGQHMFDRMRANPEAARDGQYDWGTLINIGSAPTASVAPSACPVPFSDDAVALADLTAWLGFIQASLGEAACGAVVCSNQACTLQIWWNDERAGGDAEQVIELRTRI